MTSTVVNSKTCEISEPGASMLAFLRSDLGLTAVKLACGRMRAARERARGRRAGPGVPDQAGDVAGRSVTTIQELAGSAGGVSPGDVNLIRHVLPLVGRR
jgi:hypothetical protein